MNDKTYDLELKVAELLSETKTMSSKAKASLHGLITLLGNGAIIGMVPDPFKVYAVLAFNLLQVVYAFFDTSYAVQLMGKNPQNTIPNV